MLEINRFKSILLVEKMQKKIAPRFSMEGKLCWGLNENIRNKTKMEYRRQTTLSGKINEINKRPPVAAYKWINK